MRTVLALLALPLALAACGQPKEITVSDGWVRLSAVPRHPAAAYFTLHGGPADATLYAVDSSLAIRSELHESMSTKGMASMKPLDSVPLPAGSTIAFAPGGKHVMLFDLHPAVKPGGNVPLIFTFTDGTRIAYDAKAVGAGDPAPKS